MISRKYAKNIILATIVCFVIYCQKMNRTMATLGVCSLLWGCIYTGIALAQKKHIMKILIAFVIVCISITINCLRQDPSAGLSIALPIAMALWIIYWGFKSEAIIKIIYENTLENERNEEA